MIHDETFICENCGANGPLRFLAHRETMPGDYCLLCADVEKCACCGEMMPMGLMTWKADVRNYICENCLLDYQEVGRYIKPLDREARVVEMGGNKVIKKAS